MNCKDARKYLYAFADGELDTSESLAVLEHLNMCPGCAAKVSAEQRLRSEIARVMSPCDVPAGLEQRLAEAMRREAKSSRAGVPIPAGPRRWWPGLAAAAAIGLVVVLSWPRSTPPIEIVENPVRIIPVENISFTDSSPAAVRVAEMVFRAHQDCCAMGAEHHHDPELPHDAVEAARLITQRLGVVPMLRCEQLDGVVDGHFESARLCRLVNPDGDDYDGGHMIFRLGGSDRVSLISVRHLPEVAELHKIRVDGRAYALLRPTSAPEGKPLTVVVFNCPKATHIVCAPMQPDRAIQLVGPLRFAMENAQSAHDHTVLATAGFH